MRLRYGIVQLLLTVTLCHSVAAQARQAWPEAVLLRCTVGSSNACLSSMITTDAPATSASSQPAHWQGSFLRDTLLAGQARTSASGITTPIRLLILVDVSGSMIDNNGFHTTTLVLKGFLRSVPRGDIRIAIAPFGSHQVQARIETAPFSGADSARLMADRLPPPSSADNTALYSAVQFGSQRIEKELAAAPPGAIGGLLIITDGKNDIRAGDDPGLLTSDQRGIDAARDELDRLHPRLWILGLGKQIDMHQLNALAKGYGEVDSVSIDPSQVSQRMQAVGASFWGAWEVGYPITSEREELGRGWADLQIVAGRGATAAHAAWRPPFMALPAFAAVLDPALLGERFTADGTGRADALDRRIPLGVFSAALLLMLWLVVPRLLWPPVAPAAVAAPDGQALQVATPKTIPIAAGALRTDVTEASPRGPGDLTASRARRNH